MRKFVLLFAVPALLCAAAHGEGDLPLERAIAQIDANVIFMRHAIAPGFGDPANFELSDCATQRNLDDSGRAQAARIGRAIKAAEVPITEILSSQWCRCKETAQHLQLGQWREFAGLNSFFQGLADKDSTMLLLRQELATLDDDDLVLLVTHQVVIAAATGISPPSGGLVLYNTRAKTARALTLD